MIPLSMSYDRHQMCYGRLDSMHLLPISDCRCPMEDLIPTSNILFTSVPYLITAFMRSIKWV